MIDSVVEYMEKIAKAARETPLDVAQRPRPLEQFVYMKITRPDPFLFVDISTILLMRTWLGMICNSKDGLRTLAHPTALRPFSRSARFYCYAFPAYSFILSKNSSASFSDSDLERQATSTPASNATVFTNPAIATISLSG